MTPGTNYSNIQRYFTIKVDTTIHLQNVAHIGEEERNDIVAVATFSLLKSRKLSAKWIKFKFPENELLELERVIFPRSSSTFKFIAMKWSLLTVVQARERASNCQVLTCLSLLLGTWMYQLRAKCGELLYSVTTGCHRNEIHTDIKACDDTTFVIRREDTITIDSPLVRVELGPHDVVCV